MDKEYKRKVFGLIADKFETDEIKNYFLDMCEEIPDYIFTMPSSTSGKYHNKKQCERFGQLYHIFMFSSVLEHLLRLEHNRDKWSKPEARDCMRCVPVFHDAIKCGWNGSKFTVPEHPMLAHDWVLNTKVEHDIPNGMKQFIAGLCASHSGQWNTNKKGEEIMPKPKSDSEKMVHECDILSSRPDLDYAIPEELLEILGEDTGEDLPSVEEYRLPFGKHKGKTWIEINNEDPSYVEWAKENMTFEPAKTLVCNNF